MTAHAKDQSPLDAITSDPVTQQWMVGSPPPSEKTIRFADGSYRRFPESRWSFSHMREFVPTVVIARGTGQIAELPSAHCPDIDGLEFVPLGSDERITWSKSLVRTYTDGIIVLHRGRVVYEKYFGVLTPDQPHAVFSITKSFVGTLAAAMVVDRTLDEMTFVARSLPELKHSAFGSATIGQLMDMTTGIRFDEDYAKPDAAIWDFARAGNLLPRPTGYAGPESFYAYLKTMDNDAPHGSRFAYRMPTCSTLAWVLHRVTGKPFAQLVQERIWSKLGVEHDAYCTVDSTGTAHAGGGLNATLRDLARFGEMMRLRGCYNGQQIISTQAVDLIARGGDRELFAKAGYAMKQGWSYRSMWWVLHNERGTFHARGIYGQVICVDPRAEMVIVHLGSQPDGGSDFDQISLAGYDAVAKHLMKL